jgi:serine/threonine protein kinase
VCRCGYALKGGEAAFSTADLERDLETIKELGQGANGTVFKAKHRPSGKIIALKRVKIANDAMLHDMQKEISIMNNCDSENIVDFYGSYVDRKEVWIAMEYCSGGSLTKLMERRGRAYTEEEASVIVRNVLKALVYMHMSRRCHRDIKPENILLSGRGVPKLADFGISVQMGKGIQQMATLIGTPIFLAPEIITSDGYNCFPASDHQLLTSRGFMFCHDLLAAIDCERDAAGRPLVRNGGIVKVRDWRGLRVASFDADRGALVYEQPLALVYNAPSAASGRAALVQFTSRAEARRWSAASDQGDAGVSVVATPQHNMFVRLGDARMRQMPADAVLAAASDAVQFATRAPGGVLSGAADGACSEFLDALALAPCDATPFLELYGAWLGAPGGRLLFDSCGGALEWAALESDAQAAFVAERLAALGVAWRCDGRTLRVTSTRWVDYFDAQYGHAFAGAGAAHANAHFAAAAQRARSRVARGECDGVSSADGSLLAALDGDAKWCWSWVWRLDAAALRAVLRGVVAAAGEQLTTRSARFRDELLRVLLHAGFAAHFVAAGAGAWALRFSERDAAPLRRSAGDHVRRLSAAEMQQYRGDATWCCTMSRGFVVTRRARAAGKRGDGAVVRASQPTIQGNTKVDVWALGISLIILCDGAPPYGDVDPVRAMFVISQSKESPTLSQPAEWSKELNDFVACCLHRNPTERWSSIELLSHPYIAQYAHVRTVSTSVRHDKVQTVSADDDAAAAAGAAAATATAGASAAAAAGAGASAVSAVAAAAALPASASPPALPDDDGLARSDGKSRRRASERDELVDVEKNEKEKKERDRRERKEREEREERERKEKKEKEEKEEKERERKEKKEKEEKEEKERERKERKEREEREEKEREERKERERKEKKEKEEKEEKERERKERKEREEREEKEREERKERERKEKKEKEEKEEKERERKEKKEREEREEKERKEDEEKKSRGSTRSRAADAVTRSNSDGKKSRNSGGADDAEDDDSASSGAGGGGGGGGGKESTRRRHKRTATPADQDDGDDSGSSAKNEGSGKRRTSKDKELVKQASVAVTSTRKQGATTNALDAVISAARAEPKQRKDDDKDSDNRSPRKPTATPAKGDVPKNLSGSPQRRATPSAIAAEAVDSDRVRASSDADKHEIVFVGERPAGQAPVPKPAGAAPRPKAPAPAPPASSPSGNATASSAELTKNRMRAGSISKTTSVSMATAADDDEAERLEWERILAEEREKAKKKTSTSGSTRK